MNGVLLRSDLHILFDCGLLFINPENFKVIIDKSLEKTEYQKFHELYNSYLFVGATEK